MSGAAQVRSSLAPAAEGSGLVQRIDPRVRILLALLFAASVVAMREPVALAAAFVAAFGLAVLAQLPLRRTLRRMAALEGFMVVILATVPFTVPGIPVLTLGPWTMSIEGLCQALRLALTANASVLAALALVGTMEPVTLGHALFRLRVPEKVVHLLLLTVRYTSVLDDEYARLRLAMKARGFQARGTAHTWRSFGWLFGMLLVRSFERGERILDAMKCRGFSGNFPQAVEMPRCRPADFAFAFALAGVLVGVALIERLQ